MRMVVACLALLAACGGDDRTRPTDAAVEVLVDAGMPLGGRYHLTWECLSGCTDGIRPFVDTLDADVGVLAYGYNGSITMRHDVASFTDRCVNVDDGVDAGMARDLYHLCLTNLAGTASAQMRWSTASPSRETTWRMRATQ